MKHNFTRWVNNSWTFAALLLAGTVMSGAAVAETIEVHPGQSIEAAIKRARPGDTVAVRAGIYHESVYAHASGVKVVSADGKGAAHIVSKDRTALFLQGGSGTEIRGFRVTAGPNGNGIQVGGAASGGVIRNVATLYIVADNIIHDAGLDGIKAHQAKGFTFTGNVIENAGTGNKGNADGGIDFVSVTDSVLKENTIIKTGGNSCLMLKGGTARNIITRNSFGGCKDAIHLGGFTSDSVAEPGIKEAYDNKIVRNALCGKEMAFRIFPGERSRGDNLMSDNLTGGCATAKNVGSVKAGTGGEADLAEAALGLLGNQKDALRLGLACQTRAGLLLSRQAIVDSIFGADRDRLAALDRAQVHNWLRARIRDDLSAGRTVIVDGWILSDTEAKLYALSYQSRDTPTCLW